MAGKKVSNGAKPRARGVKRPARISEADLAAGIYPEGDVRNRPEVRAWLDFWAAKGPFKLPKDLAPVWVGHRRPCASCGRLTDH